MVDRKKTLHTKEKVTAEMYDTPKKVQHTRKGANGRKSKKPTRR
jgi:hypothetical protein